MAGRGAPKHWKLRLFWLGVVLAAAYVWLLLNQGLTHLQMGITALAAILGFGLRARSAPSKFDQELFSLLRIPVLLTVTTLFAAVSLFWSAVHVSAGGVEDRTNLRLGIVPAADLADVESPGSLGTARRRSIYGGNDTIRFRTSTLPWGRHYVISVEGCPAYPFTLWPWRPGNFHVNELLDECPSLLLRIPAEFHSVLAGGRVKVRDEKRLIAEALIETDQGAVLLGRNIPVPDDLESLWETDLEASGLVGRKAISNWKRPVHVVPQRDLRPKMLLSVAFETRAGVVLARRQYAVVGKRRIEDVPLLGVR